MANPSTNSALRTTGSGLLTDMYQLTMAQGYWRLSRASRAAAFHLYFRSSPFDGGYAVCAGLEDALEYLSGLHFSGEDVEYLATIMGADGKPIFEPAFLDYLASLKFDCDVHAIPEGTVVFPHEPLLRVVGPILQCQVVETALLNIINFQTLIATKSSRICQSARGEQVLEFGLRRAQGVNGGLSASRAAYIGGCHATSNMLAGKLYGIPVRGTHAHSWIMSFEEESEAFEAYADAMPNNCVFLVDTYNTITGIERAIRVGESLRANGNELLGIRLDSGDLAYLSKQARQMLDEAGFPDALIVASNDLDESIIDSLIQQGAQISVWGVGTRLATAFDQPALGGVYKLTAMKDAEGHWQPKIKLSEQAIKVTTPGLLQVRRYFANNLAASDMIYDELIESERNTIIDPLDPTRRRRTDGYESSEDLLVPVMDKGTVCLEPKSLNAIRDRCQHQLSLFHEGIKRFVNPHQYPVGLEQELHERKTELVLASRGFQE